MSAKDIPLDKLVPLHPVRFTEKVNTFVENFNEELAVPILIDESGCLLNGTHRYSAYLLRKSKNLEPNFTFVYMEDLKDCWVGQGIEEILRDSGMWCDGNTYIDLDYFWRDNWMFSAPFCNP